MLYYFFCLYNFLLCIYCAFILFFIMSRSCLTLTLKSIYVKHLLFYYYYIFSNLQKKKISFLGPLRFFIFILRTLFLIFYLYITFNLFLFIYIFYLYTFDLLFVNIFLFYFIFIHTFIIYTFILFYLSKLKMNVHWYLTLMAAGFSTVEMADVRSGFDTSGPSQHLCVCRREMSTCSLKHSCFQL